MNAMKTMFAAAIWLSACGVANACNHKQTIEAYRAKDYARAQTLAAQGKSAYCLKIQADAAFNLGKEQDAFALYAKSWAEELDSAFDATKGTSKFWSGLGKTMAVLAAAGSVYAQSQGAMSSQQASDNIIQASELSAKIDADFKAATGNVDHRKQVKAVIKDLKTLVRRKSSSLQVVNPNWSTLPGAGMARVHVNGHVCNAVRSGKGRYIASSSCLARFGADNGKAGFISIGSMLRSSEFAQVSKIIGWDPKPVGQQEGLVFLDVTEGGADAEVASIEWMPGRLTGNEDIETGMTRYAAIWHAPEFNHLVPIFQQCTNSQFDGCGDIHANSATLWVSACETGCDWQFYGIAASGGMIETLLKVKRPKGGGS